MQKITDPQELAIQSIRLEVTALHEALHALFMRRCGASDVLIYGPHKKSGKQVNGCVVPFPEESADMDKDPMAWAKMTLAPHTLYVGNTLEDWNNYLNWYARRFPDSTEKDRNLFTGQVMAAVRSDLEEPEFQAELRELVAEAKDALTNKLGSNIEVILARHTVRLEKREKQ